MYTNTVKMVPHDRGSNKSHQGKEQVKGRDVEEGGKRGRESSEVKRHLPDIALVLTSDDSPPLFPPFSLPFPFSFI